MRTNAELMAEAQRQTIETLPIFLDDLVRAALAEAHAAIAQAEGTIGQLQSELRDVREERNDLINEVFQLKRVIRTAGGTPPKRGKPTLVVVKDSEYLGSSS